MPKNPKNTSSTSISPSVGSAVQNVFAITELLERIILQLDMGDILVEAQAVNRAWKKLIEHSTSIQQKLFFRAIPFTSINEITENRIKNPLLESIFPAFFRDQPDYSVESPLKFILNDTRPYKPWRPRRERWITTKQDAFLRKGASWRRMLVQQPTCPKMGLIQEYLPRAPWGRGFASAILSYPSCTNASDGVRMGALYDLAYRIIAHPNHRCRMCILWRQPKLEPTELDEHYFVTGKHEVVIKQHYTDDIGIVILQEGKVPGLASSIGACHGGDSCKCGEDMTMWESDPESFDTRFRSEEFKEVRIRLEKKFEQERFYGMGF